MPISSWAGTAAANIVDGIAKAAGAEPETRNALKAVTMASVGGTVALCTGDVIGGALVAYKTICHATGTKPSGAAGAIATVASLASGDFSAGADSIMDNAGDVSIDADFSVDADCAMDNVEDVSIDVDFSRGDSAHHIEYDHHLTGNSSSHIKDLGKATADIVGGVAKAAGAKRETSNALKAGTTAVVDGTIALCTGDVIGGALAGYKAGCFISGTKPSRTVEAIAKGASLASEDFSVDAHCVTDNAGDVSIGINFSRGHSTSHIEYDRLTGNSPSHINDFGVGANYSVGKSLLASYHHNEITKYGL